MHVHLQVRVIIPRRSVPSVATLLGLLAAEGVNLAAAGGSNVEFGGEFAFAVDHKHEKATFDVLNDNQYKYRKLDEDSPELELCELTDEPGQLADCIKKAETENLAKKWSIRDILVGQKTAEGKIPVQVYSEPGEDIQGASA